MTYVAPLQPVSGAPRTVSTIGRPFGVCAYSCGPYSRWRWEEMTTSGCDVTWGEVTIPGGDVAWADVPRPGPDCACWPWRRTDG